MIKYTAQITLNISLNVGLFIARPSTAAQAALSFFSQLCFKEVGRKVPTLLETSLLRLLGLAVKITEWCTLLLVHSAEPQRAANQFFKAPTGLACWRICMMVLVL